MSIKSYIVRSRLC